MSEKITKDLEDFLKATRVVEAINKSLPEGLPQLPSLSDLQFRALDRDAAGTALMATVEALGGVPAMIAWAASDPKNQAKVYEWFIKQIPQQTNIEHSGNLTVLGSLGDSPFDDFETDTDAADARH